MFANIPDSNASFKEIPRPVVCRPRMTAEPRAPPTAETLETAAAVASIAADLDASEDKEDESDGMRN